MDKESGSIPDLSGKLLSDYRLWGSAAFGSFILFIIFLLAAVFSRTGSFQMMAAVLLSGFVWIGSTSLSRHSLVRLKKYMGLEIGTTEFIMTQFVCFLFPFTYTKLKKEVELYRERSSKNRKAV